jgi:hypothetical protein
LVDKSEVLAGKWRLLRIELSEHDESGEVKGFDGYSRFWCRQAVLGTYWVAEIVDATRVKIHLNEDIELEGFEEALSFEPDSEFKRQLLSRCNWEEVVQQMFPEKPERQLSLFEGVDDE